MGPLSRAVHIDGWFDVENTRCSYRIAVLVLSIWVLLVGCGGDSSSAPKEPAAAWMEASSAAEAGWSTAKLAEARTLYDGLESAALMVVEDGRIVVSWGQVERRLFIHSVRKSLLSALIGMYVEEGRIDLDKRLVDLGIDDSPDGLTAAEKQARVVDLLQARSGVYHLSASQSESARAGLPERGSHAPGTFFYYNNWDFNALGTIFEQETGTKIFEAFQRRLAGPLEMEHFRLQNTLYDYEEQYSQHPAYHFELSARDMARFGLLYLRGGRWKDTQVVPESWVQESTTAYSWVDDSVGYGYMWWVVKDSSFLALGFGGQIIEVLPAEKLVLVYRVDTDAGDRVSTEDYYRLQALVRAARP
ncbi:MAG: serine hydrolase [Candidatus Latescibacteria bacterium]|nr:serine hydrolase [Candidatus Latescibacterota bacterium]